MKRPSLQEPNRSRVCALYDSEPMRPFSVAGVVLLLAALLAVALTDAAWAQYFGRNKVQWEDFGFHVRKTEHFDVYYYPEQSIPARDAARMAERWQARLSRFFDVELPERIPIVLYDNDTDFRQTTVAGGLIGEGVGGFTEPLRNRLVMPLSGSYAETDHVLGHEMVHVFQYAIAAAVTGRPRGGGLNALPLWMVEGLAEYLSLGRDDALTAMWLRDSVLHDDLPGFEDLGRRARYFPYRWGHAFWSYVGGRFGDGAVARLFVDAIREGVRPAIESVTGLEAKALFDAWGADIRDAYGPFVEARTEPAERARLIVSRDRHGGRYNLAPAMSPDGTRVAFLSSRNLFAIELFLADAETGRILRRLGSASGDPHFEALRFIDSAGAWSRDGTSFAFAVFAEGDNALVLVDVASGKVEQRIRLPGLETISNPTFSPDGRSIAFSGSSRGTTDLFLLELETEEVVRLTDDRHADLQPAFSPDGETLAFVSDRGAGTDFGQLTYSPMRIALLDLSSRRIRTLELFDRGRQLDPQYSPSGSSLYFLADPSGVTNVYRYSFRERAVYQVTDVPTAVSGITSLSPALSVAQREGTLAFSLFDGAEHSLYVLPAAGAAGERPQVAAADMAALPPRQTEEAGLVAAYLGRPEPGLPEEGRSYPVEPYDASLSLDFIGPPTIGVGVGVDRFGFGLAGGVSAFFGDILGRHQVGVTLQGGTSSGDFGSSVGLQASYLNRVHRWNWGAQVARVPFVSRSTSVGQTVIDVDGSEVVADVFRDIREETTINQAGMVTHFPLSLNRRFEASATWSRITFDRTVDTFVLLGNTVVDRFAESLPAPDDLDLGEVAVAFVHDTSFFGFTGPLRGSRYRFEVGTTTGDISYQTALADYRKYLFFRPASFAVRALHFGRYGDEASSDRISPLFVGRETLVRGYSFDSFDVSECTTGIGGIACPELDRLLGSRIGVLNLELRLQVLGTEDLGLASAPYFPMELAAFVDVGAAWSEDQSLELAFDRDTVERVPVVSAGLTMRALAGGYLPLELYAAYPFQRPDEDFVFGFLVTPGW